MQHFTKISEVETYVIEALGTYADEYDVEAIANAVAVRDNTTCTYSINDDAFWATVEANALSIAA